MSSYIILLVLASLSIASGYMPAECSRGESMSVHTSNLLDVEISDGIVNLVFGRKFWTPSPDSALWEFRDRNTHQHMLEIKLIYQMQFVNLEFPSVELSPTGIVAVQKDSWSVSALLTEKLQSFLSRNRLRNGGQPVDIQVFFAGA